MSALLTTVTLATQLLVAGQWIDFRLTDGTARSGALVALDKEVARVQFTEAGQEASDATPAEHALPVEQLLQVRVHTADGSSPVRPATGPASWRVTLSDGTRLIAARLQMDRSEVRVQLRPDQTLTLPTAALVSVRFGPERPAVDDQWQELLGIPGAEDRLIIRKDDRALDHLPGVVSSVADGKVRFQYDGQELDVAVEKLEGIQFYRPPATAAGEAWARVSLIHGDVWQVQQVTVADQRLRLQSVAGVSYEAPLADLLEIDFGGSKVAFLSDMEPSSVNISPQIASAAGPLLEQLIYQPRRDEAFGGRPLRLKMPGEHAPRDFDKGLALHSRTEVTYRLGGKYRKLKAWVGIDPDLSVSGRLLLQISADDVVLLEQPIDSNEAARQVDVDIQGCRRLTIVVDFGDVSDIGDRLHLADARVVK